VPCLEPGAGIGVDLLQAVVRSEGCAVEPGMAVLIRTGLMSVWPDRSRFAAKDGAGPTLEAARWLSDERGAVLLGSDTPALEQMPQLRPKSSAACSRLRPPAAGSAHPGERQFGGAWPRQCLRVRFRLPPSKAERGYGVPRPVALV
jgi:kynurenine formamidase